MADSLATKFENALIDLIEMHMQYGLTGTDVGDVLKARADDDFNSAELEPPPGVYWSREAGNFYDWHNNKGMGLVFYELWKDRKDEFPVRATTAAGLDVNLDKRVSVLIGAKTE